MSDFIEVDIEDGDVLFLNVENGIAITVISYAAHFEIDVSKMGCDDNKKYTVYGTARRRNSVIRSIRQQLGIIKDGDQNGV